MHQDQQFAAMIGHQGMHRLIRIEETRPGHLRYFFGQRSFVSAAVEGVVAVPKWLPLREVAGLHGPDQDSFGQSFLWTSLSRLHLWLRTLQSLPAASVSRQRHKTRRPVG